MYGGSGVALSGGTLTNHGTITGGSGGDGLAGVSTPTGLTDSGVVLSGATVTVTNHGTLTGGSGGSGVALSGGTLINDGTIAGGSGGTGITVSSGTLINDGTLIGGSGGSGVTPGGGTLTGDGSITGGGGGTGVVWNSGTLTNDGTIIGGSGGSGAALGGGALSTAGIVTGGSGGSGVALNGGTLTNDGTITGGTGGAAGLSGSGGSGGSGVALNGGTLINDGTIAGGAGGSGNVSSGQAGDAVQFGSLAATLVIDPGAVFIGKVAANSSVNDVLELSGTTAATLTTEFSGFSSFTEDAGADWTLTGENSFDGEVAIGGVLQEADALVSTLRMSGSGAYLTNQGTIMGGFAASGVYLMGGTLLNDGTIAAAGGVGASAVEFGGPATLAFGRNAVFDGAITGFGSGDTLVAENKVLTSATYVSGTGLELSGAGGTATIDLIGNFGADTFLLSNNGTSTSIGLDTTGEIYTITGVVKVGVTPGEGRYYRTLTVTGSVTPNAYGVNAISGTVGGVYVLNEGLLKGADGLQSAGAPGGSGAVFTNGMLVNTGTISGGRGGNTEVIPAGAGGTGVLLQGGTALNTGTIQGGIGGQTTGDVAAGTGGNGVVLQGGTFSNGGTIIGGQGGNYFFPGRQVGAGGAGAYLLGGSLTNTSVITGGTGGRNYGGIGGAGGAGVSLHGGSLTNLGSITGGTGYTGRTGPGAGGVGAYLDGGTLINAGTISGTAGADAVQFGPDAAALAVDPGAVFDGSVVANGLVDDVLELAEGNGDPGTLDGLGTQFTGFSGLDFLPGGRWTVYATLAALDGGQTVAGFAGGDSIVLENFAAAGNTYVAGTGLELTSGGNTYTLDLSIPANDVPSVRVTAGNTVIRALIGTISTAVNSPVTVGAGFYASTLTITDTGSVVPSTYSATAITLDTAGYVLLNEGVVQGGGGSVGNQYGYSGGNGGTGVDLSGGTLTNEGSIGGGGGGDAYPASPGSGGNGGSGVVLSGGGTLTNGGTISGGDGGSSGGRGGVGSGGSGVVLSGGTLTNDGAIDGGGGGYSGFLRGGNGGSGVMLSGGALTNYGTINGGGGGGGSFQGGSGGSGVVLSGGTLTDAGTINGGGGGGGGVSGQAGDAVQFGSLAATLVIDPGAVFTGQVAANSSVNDVLELAQGNGNQGTLSSLGTQFTGFSDLDFLPGSTWTVDATVAALDGDQTIAGFSAGDTIDLTNVSYDSTGQATLLGGNKLQVSENGSSYDLQLSPTDDFTGDYFHLASDGSHGTNVTENNVPCFCRGTRILTDRGEVAVQHLAVGDLVLTAAGVAMPLVWIGTGQVMVTRGRRSAATPVIVRKGALGDNVPNRDLRVTKGHALLLDGVLVPVEFLVNHRSIQWDDHAQEVSFYHLELASHQVLVANGTPAESYRDDGNRWLFRNHNEGWSQPPKPPCAPVLTGGPVVDAIWRRLLERAGPLRVPPLTNEPDLHLLVDGKCVKSKRGRGGQPGGQSGYQSGGW